MSSSYYLLTLIGQLLSLISSSSLSLSLIYSTLYASIAFQEAEYFGACYLHYKVEAQPWSNSLIGRSSKMMMLVLSCQANQALLEFLLCMLASL